MVNNPLDILKRLDIKQNVTIRIIDEPTGEVVQEHVGHNAATHSMLVGIAHYLMGDGVLNQGSDTLSMWIPQYISLGTMGLTSQDSETLIIDNKEYIVPKALGDTPVAPNDATAQEKELNAVLRFTEYLNQTPGFGADGYDSNTNNDRKWFGLGYPYTLKPNKMNQYFGDAGSDTYTLSTPVLDKSKDNIISVIVYPNGIINQDMHNESITRIQIPYSDYSINSAGTMVTITNGTSYSGRIAIMYYIESTDAANCELIKSKIDKYNNYVPLTLRSNITYRSIVPEYMSEVPSTLDVVFSSFVSTGALSEYRGDRDYIYITEAGLWAKNAYTGAGDNGLLAGYRITPTDVDDTGLLQQFTGDGTTKTFIFENDIVTEIIAVVITDQETPEYYLDTNTNAIVFETAPADGSTITVSYKTAYTQDSWKDMTILSNRQKVQQSILRIGPNQVAQVVWKIQLGGLEQLSGLRNLYPSQYQEEVWTIV